MIEIITNAIDDCIKKAGKDGPNLGRLNSSEVPPALIELTGIVLGEIASKKRGNGFPLSVFAGLPWAKRFAEQQFYEGASVPIIYLMGVESVVKGWYERALENGGSLPAEDPKIAHLVNALYDAPEQLGTLPDILAAREQ